MPFTTLLSTIEIELRPLDRLISFRLPIRVVRLFAMRTLLPIVDLSIVVLESDGVQIVSLSIQLNGRYFDLRKQATWRHI